MGLYRKKPVVIEAMHFEGNAFAVRGWAFLHGVHIEVDTADNDVIVALIIPTLEGEMRADPGDWIIRGVAGELYPCKPDIFAATYEPADDATSIAANMVLTAAQSPGEDSIIETVDDAGDMHDIGPPVKEARYTRPKDKRVQTLLDDAAKARAAEAAQTPRTIFTDPRRDPDYRPPNKR